MNSETFLTGKQKLQQAANAPKLTVKQSREKSYTDYSTAKSAQ
jgi:hypothetical protein